MPYKSKILNKAIEYMYDSVCTVTEYKKVKNPVTKVTDYEEVVVLEGQPCKLSYEKITTVVQSESSAAVAQSVKLFISPDVLIKPGSKITVTTGNNTVDYTFSGMPARYQAHQEIILELFSGWA